jgi:hypothetical protein
MNIYLSTCDSTLTWPTSASGQRVENVNFQHAENFWSFYFAHCSVFEKPENTSFQIMNVFPSTCEGDAETHNLLGPWGKANQDHRTRLALSRGLNRVGVPTLHQDGNTFNFRNVVFLVFRIPDDGQSPKNSPSSEPFRIYCKDIMTYAYETQVFHFVSVFFSTLSLFPFLTRHLTVYMVTWTDHVITATFLRTNVGQRVVTFTWVWLYVFT